jgi:DDE superfamily endonuclease
MWVVADLDEDYIAKMEDVLELYERPYDQQEPVVCLDEKPITLHADLRPASPAVPGREARRDNEYERRGTANVFCAVEPKAGAPFHLPHARSFRLRVRSGDGRSGTGIPGSEDYPSDHGQPEHPSTQSTGGRLR